MLKQANEGDPLVFQGLYADSFEANSNEKINTLLENLLLEKIEKAFSNKDVEAAKWISRIFYEKRNFPAIYIKKREEALWAAITCANIEDLITRYSGFYLFDYQPLNSPVTMRDTIRIKINHLLQLEPPIQFLMSGGPLHSKNPTLTIYPSETIDYDRFKDAVIKSNLAPWLSELSLNNPHPRLVFNEDSWNEFKKIVLANDKAATLDQ